jgi:hypothetical protein
VERDIFLKKIQSMLLIVVSLMLSFLTTSYNEDTFIQEFEAKDIDHFWSAYDKIIRTEDTLEQRKYLKEMYLEKGTEGLKDIIEVRGYSEAEFLNAIKSYPDFWKSIKGNTLKTSDYQKEITEDIRKLKRAYPDLAPSKIFFTIGAFRTNGTIKGRNVLIGCELALADENTIVDELPAWRQPFYREYKPLKNLSLLCTHEYIHTQQNELVENLLSMCLYEGVAEFISCHVTGKSSNSPAIEFGKENEKLVVDKFVDDLYLMSNTYNWLWGENRNELKIRDLGYYIGYEISERYFNQAKDKTKAIKELIELDYTNEKEVERIVDASKLLPKPIAQLYDDYEKKRPTVIKIKEFENGEKHVDPTVNSITVIFSEELNGIHNGLDYGELGEEFYPKVDNTSRKWGEDNRSYSFHVDLQPNKKYQMVIGSNFRLSNGIRLKPFVIEFQTKE